MSGRVFHVGESETVRAALTERFGAPPRLGPVRNLARGDLVVVEAFGELAGRGDVPGRNAFSACRAWKERAGVAVHVVVRADDPVGVQLARFVLADGVLVEDGGRLDGLEQLQPAGERRAPRLIDSLLERYGAALVPGDRSSALLERVREWESADDFLVRLQDEETGLFDGRYTALKLDEEFKRSERFHLPLSLLLLDIGAAAAGLPEGPHRRALLAEVASVFLNECRDIDVLGRFTATVFLFLLPGTPPAGAAALGRRMLTALRERRFSSALAPVASVVSVPTSGIADRKDLLMVAEHCLERARAGQGVGGLVSAWE